MGGCVPNVYTYYPSPTNRFQCITIRPRIFDFAIISGISLSIRTRCLWPIRVRPQALYQFASSFQYFHHPMGFQALRNTKTLSRDNFNIYIKEYFGEVRSDLVNYDPPYFSTNPEGSGTACKSMGEVMEECFVYEWAAMYMVQSVGGRIQLYSNCNYWY